MDPFVVAQAQEEMGMWWQCGLVEILLSRQEGMSVPDKD